MAGQDTGFREAIRAIPQVDFDIIGRLTPGMIVIGSILLAIIGPENFWNKSQSFLNKSSGFSIPAFTVLTLLVVLVSYTLATFLRCVYSSPMMWHYKKEYWDNKDFRWKYENIKYKNPAAGNRITKLKAQVHMAETLFAGFILSSLIAFVGYLCHLSDLQRLLSLGFLILAAFCSWNAGRYFIRHMKASLDNNLKILKGKEGN